MRFTEQFDVVVVGAGHAGCEAAMAAARMGLKTALYTLNVDLIAQMSCNPAIGGIAKGHLVREVDALGGIMGEITDAVGIQFRLLNTSRGPAVWSPRAQCDKQAYRLKMREVLESQPNLKIKQAEVADLIVEPSLDDADCRSAERNEDETVFANDAPRAAQNNEGKRAFAMVVPSEPPRWSSPPALSLTASFIAASSSILPDAPASRPQSYSARLSSSSACAAVGSRPELRRVLMAALSIGRVSRCSPEIQTLRPSAFEPGVSLTMIHKFLVTSPGPRPKLTALSGRTFIALPCTADKSIPLDRATALRLKTRLSSFPTK
jgi:Glucose inhibited division protein A